MTEPERGIWLDNATQREDLATFVERALRLDEAAVIRLRERAGGLVGGLGVHRVRRVGQPCGGGPRSSPRTCRAGADALAAGLTAMDSSGYVETGFRDGLGVAGRACRRSGFVHLDDVPAGVVLDLAQRGVALAKEHSSAHGPPASLLDQEVVAVSAGDAVGIPMRCVFALTAMGFLPQSGEAAAPDRRDRPGAGASGVAASRRAFRVGVPATSPR